MIRVVRAAAQDITLERLFRSLKYRDYRLLWVGQACHAGALWIEMVARPWPVSYTHLTLPTNREV